MFTLVVLLVAEAPVGSDTTEKVLEYEQIAGLHGRVKLMALP